MENQLQGKTGKKKALIYHSADPDGLLSGYLLDLVNSDQDLNKDEFELIPYNYELTADWMYSNFNHFEFVDVTPPLLWLGSISNELLDGSIYIKIFDHHKNRCKGIIDHFDPITYYGKLDIVYNSEKSGAKIYYDHYIKKLSKYQFLDFIVNYVSDYDTWNFVKSTRKPYVEDLLKFNEYLFHLKTFDEFKLCIDSIIKSKNIMQVFTDILMIGENFINVKKSENEYNIEKGYYIQEHDCLLYAGTTNYWFLEQSKKLYPNIKVWIGFKFVPVNNTIKFSLRSHKSNDFDVASLAEKFGGNGHYNAAGFTVMYDLGLELIKTPEKIFSLIPSFS